MAEYVNTHWRNKHITVVRNLRERNRSGDLNLDGRKIWKQMLKNEL
jgi:hypothetical protein